jgi:hypothetical protein
MWQRLLKILEAIGRVRIPWPKTKLTVSTGRADALDAQGELLWKQYLSAEVLFDTWGPAKGSPWEPYHCVTLFAALDRFPGGIIGPTDPESAAAIEAALGDPSFFPGWAGPGVFVLVDLPGVQSVALGSRLIQAGMQPVCTFDNWPHPAGLLKPENILAQLLRYASTVDSARATLAPDSPPVWLCDRDRFGIRPGRPLEFDNRYYLDDSVLPGIDVLRKAGISTAICLLPSGREALLDDLHPYFAGLRKGGIETLRTSLEEPEMRLALLEVQSGKKPSFRQFRRSSAGGFGASVPEPSSGSGG